MSAGFEPELAAWEPWTPAQVLERLRAVPAPWYVAGGWALDLFLGARTREHEDIEIGVPAHRFHELVAPLSDCELFLIDAGLAYPLQSSDDPRLASSHQTWVRERASGRWRLDIFREPSASGVWVARRDARIRLPYERLIVRDAAGIPFARPEVILLFKAKAARPKDESDFMQVLPALDAQARAWLAWALALVHPGHPWLAILARWN